MREETEGDGPRVVLLQRSYGTLKNAVELCEAMERGRGFELVLSRRQARRLVGLLDSTRAMFSMRPQATGVARLVSFLACFLQIFEFIWRWLAIFVLSPRLSYVVCAAGEDEYATVPMGDGKVKVMFWR